MGIHEVDIEVMDQQSFGKVQTVTVRICECRNGVCLAKQTSTTLGPMGWLALLLPLLLLLLLCKSHCYHPCELNIAAFMSKKVRIECVKKSERERI